MQIPDEGFRVGDCRFRILDIGRSCTLDLILNLICPHLRQIRAIEANEIAQLQRPCRVHLLIVQPINR